MSRSSESILLNVPRECVEEGDPTPVLQGLMVCARGPVTGPQALGKVRIGFDGYELDSRELWEIPEVRAFVQQLNDQFPFWFFVCDLGDESLATIAFCCCRVREIGEGATTLNRTDFQNFANRQFAGMNALWDQHRIPESDNVVRSEAIVAYFASRAIMN